MKDRRYTVTPEFTGHASGKKRFVVRFQGNYITDCETRDKAEKEVARLKKERDVQLSTAGTA